MPEAGRLMLSTEPIVTVDPGKPTFLQIASNWASMAARFCFAAAIVLIPFRYNIDLLARPAPPIHSGYTDFQLYASDIVVLAALILWAISFTLSPRRLSFGPRHLWLPLAGLTLAGWISAVSSYDPGYSVYQGIRLVVLFWFYLYVVNEIGSLRWVMVPVGIQIGIQAIVALGQFAAQRSIGLQAIGEPPLDPAAIGTSVVMANGVRLLRAYGLSDHPNIVGGCLAFGLVLLIVPSLRRSTRAAAYAAFIPASAALVITFSRSAWLAFAGGAAVIAVVEVLSRRGAARDLLWLGLASAALPVALVLAYSPFFGMRVNVDNSFIGATAEQQSLGERIILVQSALPLIRDHPVTGVGLGASPLALRAYYPNLDASYAPPHWALLDAALETGALGATFYLALLVFPFVAYIRQRHEVPLNPSATAAVALLVSITLVGFFDYYTWLLAAGRLWQWLAWGLWAWVWENCIAQSAIVSKQASLQSVSMLST